MKFIMPKYIECNKQYNVVITNAEEVLNEKYQMIKLTMKNLDGEGSIQDNIFNTIKGKTETFIKSLGFKPEDNFEISPSQLLDTKITIITENGKEKDNGGFFPKVKEYIQYTPFN